MRQDILPDRESFFHSLGVALQMTHPQDQKYYNDQLGIEVSLFLAQGQNWVSHGQSKEEWWDEFSAKIAEQFKEECARSNLRSFITLDPDAKIPGLSQPSNQSRKRKRNSSS
mmetsp:Transcript_1613/g.2485  ORF Transcript_1613/g.2485 Transcript_1613/m.2485 type:complete len:112 (-) Transcript_1613:2-337(-)